MTTNCAFLAAMVTLLLTGWVLGQVDFLAPYKRVLIHEYLWHVVAAIGLVFLNLFALFLLTARRLFLKETGRKLAHVGKQLQTKDTVDRELSERLAREHEGA
jgi:ABC-type microcin C transport system permease subunit YejB